MRTLAHALTQVSVFAALAIAGFACAGGGRGWDLAALEARHPQLLQIPDRGLQDAVPYFAPASQGLALVLCRWSTAAPIPVWLPPYASATETRAIELALTAWEGAGLGVRFARTSQNAEGPDREEPPSLGIVFEIVGARRGGPAGAADTIADCSVPEEVADAEQSDAPVDAELQYASIHLRRELRNELGRAVPLTETELLGAVVHELGHALGFPGHVAGPGKLMSAHGQVDMARRWGRRIQRGEPLEAPTLSALYAVPSGVRVGWLPLGRAQQDPLRTVAALATRSSLRGPWVRVSSESARILWRHAQGHSASVVIRQWSVALRDPSRFDARLNRLARLLVEQAARR
jgi:hypothetical protein